MQKIKNNKGITLVALVVIIIVLLILAAVSINLVFGDNGIITRAKQARIDTRYDSVNEKVELWKDENKIRKENKEQLVSSEELINDLLSSGLIKENEIDRENEIIRIENKEIDYSSFIFQIIEYSNGEQANGVVLQAMVEGTETLHFNSEVELINYCYGKFDEMTTDDKLEKLKDTIQIYTGENISSIDNLLQVLLDQELIEEKTIAAFENSLNNSEIKDSYVYMFFCNSVFGEYRIYDDIDNMRVELYLYRVVNPNGEVQNKYFTNENGEYTFEVENINTGKKYSKTVTVNNIDNEMKKIQVQCPDIRVLLTDTTDNTYLSYDEAYVILDDGKQVTISKYIQQQDDYYDCGFIICDIMDDIDDIYANSNNIIKIVKDNKSYYGLIMSRQRPA